MGGQSSGRPSLKLLPVKMGASESKLVFKQGIFRLQDSKPIAADDPYWTGFWELPDYTEDVFSLFSANDIRRTRDGSLPNLETLILAVTSRLFSLRKHPSFPSTDLAPEKDALNCIRILTRLLPFLYEADHLEAWEETFFWATRRKRTRKGQLRKEEVLFDESRTEEELPETPDAEGIFEEAKPLAEELIDTLLDFLFFSAFTIPVIDRSKTKVNYNIWTSGVGCNHPVQTNAHLESNRTEVLRLLLTIASKSMYMPATLLPLKGVKALTYIATCSDKQIVLSTLCSLLNTVLRFNPTTWKIPYDYVVVGDPKSLYMASCLQFLLVLLLYPIPEQSRGGTPKNFFRHFLGRLHREQDFDFIAEGMSKTLHQPLAATSSYLPGSQKPVRWSPEMTMLFWETIQCNKRFRTYIVDTDRLYDFTLLMLYYAIEYRTEPTKQGIVRMCVFVLQTLSAEENFAPRLNKIFEDQDALPAAIRINDWSGTYGDFLVMSIHTLMTGSKGKLDAIYPALLAIMNNVAPYLEGLNSLSCLKFLQLFVSMSSPSFLLANESNHDLLTSLLESINAIVEHKYKENPKFVTAILKSRKRFETLRSFTLESGQAEMERLSQLRKESAEGTESIRSPMRSSWNGSTDSIRTPVSARMPSLSNVPEEGGTFAIGDDEDSDNEGQSLQHTPSQSVISNHDSRAHSIDSSVDDAVPAQLRGMSEKARGKMPADKPSFSRVNSMTSVTSHPGTLSTVQVGFHPSPQWIETWLPTLPLHTILTLLQSTADTTPPKALPAHIDPSPPRLHLFEWTPLSLGWYESLLWSFIYSSEMLVEKGAVGVWNGTAIRLFKVEKEAARGPSLMKPMGAVDAVGSSIVQRIGGLNIRGAVNSLRSPTTPTVRDV